MPMWFGATKARSRSDCTLRSKLVEAPSEREHRLRARAQAARRPAACGCQLRGSCDWRIRPSPVSTATTSSRRARPNVDDALAATPGKPSATPAVRSSVEVVECREPLPGDRIGVWVPFKCLAADESGGSECLRVSRAPAANCAIVTRCGRSRPRGDYIGIRRERHHRDIPSAIGLQYNTAP